ncbi:MAG: NAD-dependent epimerase/dehydratase family protein [Defluviicoccus sp.]|nr:NAD-dependent epimerase/dehydratase family protein [Defluviicoccus sp.]MDE0384450.1 NAD-dependent epimerase/dehydratase family protein [Defluviicoccus sp.]
MILVTGGAGFVGSNLIAGLEARGHRGIAVCDRLGAGARWRNLARRAVGTVFPPERLNGFLDEAGGAVEAVYHIGLHEGGWDVDRMLEANYHAAAALWAWCAANGVRFFWASTAETYGDGSAGFDDDIHEAALARLVPSTARGWAKHLFDRAVARTIAAGSPRPPQWAGLKLFDVYGPNEYHKDEPSLPLMLWRGTAPPGLDPGTRRDLVWIGDCLAVMLWLLDNEEVSGLFNVGTGQSRRIDEIAAAVGAAACREVELPAGATPETPCARYRHSTEARMRRLRSAGYDGAFLTIEDGIAHYVGEFLSRGEAHL